jgi:hypothetical protein
MRDIGQGMAQYLNDNVNYLPTFSWGVGPSPAIPGTIGAGQSFFTDLQATSFQAINIIQRRDGAVLPVPANWVPHIYYSHLALSDYLARNPRQDWSLCPSDSARAALQQTPPVDPDLTRWAYSSSYSLPPASFSPNGGPNAIAQASSHNTFTVPGVQGVLGRRRIQEVLHPSKKVWLYDEVARHTPERAYYYAYDNASQPLLFFDLSVQLRLTRTGNRGFIPTQPTNPSVTIISYSPSNSPVDLGWPATHAGTSTANYIARWKFGRSGLRARDFDGPEVPWGQ